MDDIIIPEHIGYITGIRAWHVMYPGFLVDANRKTVYEPFVRQQAVCLTNAHDAPRVDCACGFYLLKPNILLTRDVPWSNFHGYIRQTPVWGLCAGWGKVIELEFGWRVEFAYPKQLFVQTMDNLSPSAHLDIAFQLGECYGVPISQKPFETAFPRPIAAPSPPICQPWRPTPFQGGRFGPRVSYRQVQAQVKAKVREDTRKAKEEEKAAWREFRKEKIAEKRRKMY